MYRESNKGWLKHIDFQIIDIISLELAFFLAYLTRHGLQFSMLSKRAYQAMFFVLIIIDFASATLLHTFNNVLRRGYYAEAVATLKQTALVGLLAILFLFVIKEGNEFSRVAHFLTAIYYFIISYSTRRIWRIHIKRRPITNNAMILLVTTSYEAPEMILNYKENNYSNAGIKGLVITDRSVIGSKIDGYTVLADKDSAEQYTLNHWVDEVLIGLSVDHDIVMRLEEAFLEMGITVHQSLLELTSNTYFERRIEQIGSYTVMTRSIKILTARENILKRFLDIIGGLVGCLITLFLVIFVGPAIYIASPGPIFFAQQRVGQNGKYFNMYKFRSMYLDAEERKAELMEKNQINGFMFKMDNDPRVIGSEKGKGKGIGNFIRRTSIDEFPQFINVLKGEMSLVGTRPPTINEWKEYEKHHRARLSTKPGVTGMWQVSGRSNITDFEEVVRLDMEYIENWSFGLDIKLIVKTIIKVLKGEGAK